MPSSNPLVSVIVPVYKVEKFLERCLESICSQSLHDIEIICVNDCSPDNSAQILEKFAQTDTRIKIVNLPVNGGLGNARNQGLNVAIGEYIGFVDSDDYIDFDFYERLYQAAKSNDADISFTEYKQNDGGNFFINYNEPGVYHGLAEKYGALKNGPVWVRLLRREMIENNHLSFIKGVTLEDNPFTIKSFYYANKVVAIEGTYYNYIINSTSIMNNSRNFAIRERDSLIIANEILEFFKEKGVHEELNDWANNYIIKNVAQRPSFINQKTYFAWKKLLNNHPRLKRFRFQALRNWVFNCSLSKRRLVILGHKFL